MEEGSGRFRLPVLATLDHAGREVLGKRRELLRSLFILALIGMALDFLSFRTVANGLAAPTFVLRILQLGLYAMFAVTCHRIILLGSEFVPKYGILSFSGRELKFVGYMIAISALMSLGALILGVPAMLMTDAIADDGSFGFGGMILVGAFMILGVYVFSRISLVLPSVAIERSIKVEGAWRISRGNGWRVVLACSLWPIVLSLAYIPFYLVLDAPVADVVTLPLDYLIVVFTIASLSVTFLALAGDDLEELAAEPVESAG